MRIFNSLAFGFGTSCPSYRQKMLTDDMATNTYSGRVNIIKYVKVGGALALRPSCQALERQHRLRLCHL